MDGPIFTDRYGGHDPDPRTCCKGPCEGMGQVPVPRDEADPLFAWLYNQAEALHGSSQDGWQFVACPYCDGTGRRPGLLRRLRLAWRRTWIRIGGGGRP
jgi:hypothetical protein